MVKKPTLILLGIMAVLIAFAVYTQKNPSILKGDSTPTATKIPSPLSDWKLDETRLIKYEDPQGKSISLRMGKDFSNWSIDQNSQTPADAGKVTQLISELQSLQPVSKLESSTDESAMGIGTQSKKITLVDGSGSTKEIVIGEKTATGSGYYVKVADVIYIVNTYALQNITDLLTMDSMIKKTETPTVQVSETPKP
ncbi:hypothetical protein hrd7_29130 [Leptolinea sp. HRD-7]|jgi:hypothetical protein|nr:hypothetical protein hrd7_29130 [Leptolinea sp. HRD-7]